MTEEFDLEKIKNQYPEFFKDASDKLIELALSPETASQIAEICLKNGIEEEEKIEKIAYYISFVLLSQLPPETLPKTLEREVKIGVEKAKKIFEEVSQVIFSPVKDDLAKLYGAEKTPTPSIKEKLKEEPEEKPKRPPGKDIYHEPIE